MTHVWLCFVAPSKDPEELKSKTAELQQAAMKIGEAVYGKQGGDAEQVRAEMLKAALLSLKARCGTQVRKEHQAQLWICCEGSVLCRP